MTQASAIMTVELCSILVILNTFRPANTVFDFIALAIIAAFDDYVYSSMTNEILKKLLNEDIVDDLCIIVHTSSKRCQSWELAEL